MEKYTKRDAKRVLGVKSDYALAKIFGVTRQAMQKIPESGHLSETRQWQIRALLAERKTERVGSGGKNI